MNLTYMIEHTKLDTDSTSEDIERLCSEAIQYGFKGVCVRSDMVRTASQYLKNSGVKVVSVVGFPTKKCPTLEEMVDELGKYSTTDKVVETRKAMMDGADEIDMVINLGLLKRGEYISFSEDISSVVEAAEKGGVRYPVKVIIETGYLTEKEKKKACIIAESCGARFLKTSTGYGISGAKTEDILLMNNILNFSTGIKASGGIRTRSFAIELYEASQERGGRDFRIGASSGIKIIKEMENQ